jgi:hypothetical protein
LAVVVTLVIDFVVTVSTTTSIFCISVLNESTLAPLLFLEMMSTFYISVSFGKYTRYSGDSILISIQSTRSLGKIIVCVTRSIHGTTNRNGSKRTRNSHHHSVGHLPMGIVSDNTEWLGRSSPISECIRGSTVEMGCCTMVMRRYLLQIRFHHRTPEVFASVCEYFFRRAVVHIDLLEYEFCHLNASSAYPSRISLACFQGYHSTAQLFHWFEGDMD